MRTTVTLDPDVAALVRQAMGQRGSSFKAVINQALRETLAPDRTPFETPTYAMGHEPGVPLDKALRLAAELEDEELVRKLALRK
ncbi:MAG: CopG family transcriptional regulator [Egibacteraceae bacterium]